MAPPKKPDSGVSKGERAPWLKGVSGVEGITPPGRRLSPPTEKRPTRWSASGVKGIRPPGNLAPGEGPASEHADALEKKRRLREKANKRALDESTRKQAPKGARAAKASQPPDSGRPTAGFQPNPFTGHSDPPDIKTYLELIAELTKKLEPSEACGGHLAELILQSHAPFEIIVAFTILSVIVGKSTQLRRKHAQPLERGAKTFYNLAIRMDTTKTVKAPRGLIPETMDAIFWDLPKTAYQMPFAFATDAFCRMLELLQSERPKDAELIRFALELRARFIEGRSLADKSLAALFPWDTPDWAPDLDD